MTTLTDFAPKTGWRFTATRFVDHVPQLCHEEKEKDCAFFLDSVTNGCYGNCESIYFDGCIRSMGYKFTPDERVSILVKQEGGYGFVTRFLPGRLEDYTVAQIDKWVREFDGAATWCVMPAVRWVPSLKDKDLYDVDPNARPTITNETF